MWPRLRPFAPSVIGLFGDTDLLAGFGDTGALAEVYLSFPEFIDDLFLCVPLFDHLSPLFVLFY